MLDLSSVYAYGQYITNSLWNELRTLLEAKFAGGIGSTDIAAGGVANSNLANSKYWITVEQRITPPPLTTYEPDNGPWYDPSPPDLDAAIFDGYLKNLTMWRAPCAMTIKSLWICTRSNDADPNGDLKLYRKSTGGAWGALSDALDCSLLDPTSVEGNLIDGVSLSVLEGDLLAWRSDKLNNVGYLNIDVGFAALAELTS